MGDDGFEPSTLHYLVVKVLSDLNLNKTLKKLRKETNCKKLKPQYIPESIQNLNYKKLVKLCNKYKTGDGFKVVNSEGDAVNTKAEHNTAYFSDNSIRPTNSQGDQSDEAEFQNEAEYTTHRTYETGSKKRKGFNQLKTMKGKDFKSQKHKRKRGSWSSSGEITNSVKSIIFND